MLTQRTIRKWRGEALKISYQIRMAKPDALKRNSWESVTLQLVDQVLRLTQDLLDLHLLGRVK